VKVFESGESPLLLIRTLYLPEGVFQTVAITLSPYCPEWKSAGKTRQQKRPTSEEISLYYQLLM